MAFLRQLCTYLGEDSLAEEAIAVMLRGIAILVLAPICFLLGLASHGGEVRRRNHCSSSPVRFSLYGLFLFLRRQLDLIGSIRQVLAVALLIRRRRASSSRMNSETRVRPCRLLPPSSRLRVRQARLPARPRLPRRHRHHARRHPSRPRPRRQLPQLGRRRGRVQPHHRRPRPAPRRRDRLRPVRGPHRRRRRRGIALRAGGDSKRLCGHSDVLLRRGGGRVGAARSAPAARWNTAGRPSATAAVRRLGITTHQRPLAAEAARSGKLDLLMIRYNAAHRGAETEVFPADRRRRHAGRSPIPPCAGAACCGRRRTTRPASRRRPRRRGIASCCRTPPSRSRWRRRTTAASWKKT